jgi:hypothetical protein
MWSKTLFVKFKILTLSTATLPVQDDLVSVVTVISSLEYLLLGLNLLVIWQLC